MKQVQFTVSIEDANLILEGLGLLPFARVYQLVGNLQEQAKRQLTTDAETPSTTASTATDARRPAVSAVHESS